MAVVEFVAPFAVVVVVAGGGVVVLNGLVTECVDVVVGPADMSA